MKYDFDQEVNRRGTGSMKWNVPENILPMWVADMDFQTAPEIRQAMQRRLDHGVFGYAEISKEWEDAYINWWKQYHGWEIDPEWIFFSTGVVPTLSSVVRKLTTPNENVVILTPVYNIFYNSILNNGARVLESPLIYNGTSYEIDFEDLEEKLSRTQTSLMIFCNPHNPVGKVWDRETLAKVGELCKKHYVTVISDEIHCDLTDPGIEYIPFASVSQTCRDISVTCIAPTKTFNLAGLQTSAVVVPNEYLRIKVNRGLNTDECAEPNVFAVEAPIAAFTKGYPWLIELRQYLYENKERVRTFVKEELVKVKVLPSGATYLLWIDVRELEEGKKTKLVDYLYEETGLYLADGSHYGPTGEGFLRMNCACTRKNLEEGLLRLKAGIHRYIEQ